MSEWHAQAWGDDQVADVTVTAETIAEAAAKITAELDHLDLVELNIRRDDR